MTPGSLIRCSEERDERVVQDDRLEKTADHLLGRRLLFFRDLKKPPQGFDPDPPLRRCSTETKAALQANGAGSLGQPAEIVDPTDR